MSRGTWTIEIQESNGSYTSDGTIYKPNQSLSIPLISTHSKVILADGSFAFITPETKSNNNTLTFIWNEIDDSDDIITKLQGYVTNGDTVRITTHLSSTYTGRFVSINKTHLVGVDDTFDIEAQLDQS